ncbi:hypothetical protein [Rufibacter roseus]|uniref:Entericidin n=1 Tax=Rufibacter roseus TaxID=1567108 RepID=A0ABW2DHK2_9BACT|nr:hypothetical protein [Rufibacter roseus]
MRNFVSLLAVAGLTMCFACDAKKAEETPKTDVSTNATDIAETTASPLDTVGAAVDTLATDSVDNQ